MGRWILTLALLASSAIAVADPIYYDESVDGDLDGSQSFEFDFGDNIIVGSSQSSGDLTGARDLDPFSFSLSEFAALDSITFEWSGGLTPDSDESSARMTFRIGDESGGVCATGALWVNVLGAPGSRSTEMCGSADLSDLGAGLFSFYHGLTMGAGTTGDSWNYTLTFTVEDTRSVPEPGTLSLLGVGLLAIGASRRRRKKT